METEPNFDDVEVTERPQNTTKTGTVTNVIKGTRQEIYDLEDGEELEYGEMDDVLVQIVAEVEHEGDTIEVQDSVAYYDSPSLQSAFGKYINRYGKPESGQEVDFTFDDDGRAKVVGIR